MAKTTKLFDEEEVLRIHLSNVARESWKKGYKKGFREGFRKGFREGRKETALKVARTALQLGQNTIEEIAYYTDLTIDEVKRIAESEDLQK
ncbi:MAG: hypothetical protein Q4G03_10610 [Planctomycetia bacterium]|nr:hypothetical protein [Planctomycetia bacterium]